VGELRVLLEHARCALFTGDSADLGQVLPENSVDALLTDPPSAMSFMARKWDSDRGGRDEWVRWLARTLEPSYRALKPGAHGACWAIPRTSHWAALALEFVGFEIRDVHHDLLTVDGLVDAFVATLDDTQRAAFDRLLSSQVEPIVYHLFGQGFPKSLTSASANIPSTEGTALKPAAEHWIIVRKPLGKLTVAECRAKYGTGTLGIDACRGASEHSADRGDDERTYANDDRAFHVTPGPRGGAAAGRWPAHLSLDEGVAEILDAQTGELRSGALAAGTPRGENQIFGKAPGTAATLTDIKSSRGGASRYFYVRKPTRKEKEFGLEHLVPRGGGEATGRPEGSAGIKNARAGAGRTGGARNIHPTVKSVELMRWLIELIAPNKDATVIDPFAGSGSTAVAALESGRSFVGCELGGDNGEYLPVLEGRVRHALGLPATL
jgi:site-specific DNA-methyltransferase (adenine-specific)